MIDGPGLSPERFFATADNHILCARAHFLPIILSARKEIKLSSIAIEFLCHLISMVRRKRKYPNCIRILRKVMDEG